MSSKRWQVFVFAEIFLLLWWKSSWPPFPRPLWQPPTWSWHASLLPPQQHLHTHASHFGWNVQPPHSPPWRTPRPSHGRLLSPSSQVIHDLCYTHTPLHTLTHPPICETPVISTKTNQNVATVRFPWPPASSWNTCPSFFFVPQLLSNTFISTPALP